MSIRFVEATNPSTLPGIFAEITSSVRENILLNPKIRVW